MRKVETRDLSLIGSDFRGASASRQDSPREGELAASQAAVEPVRAMLPNPLDNPTFMMAPTLDTSAQLEQVGMEPFPVDFGPLSVASMESPSYDYQVCTTSCPLQPPRRRFFKQATMHDVVFFDCSARSRSCLHNNSSSCWRRNNSVWERPTPPSPTPTCSTVLPRPLKISTSPACRHQPVSLQPKSLSHLFSRNSVQLA